MKEINFKKVYQLFSSGNTLANQDKEINFKNIKMLGRGAQGEVYLVNVMGSNGKEE